MSGGYRHGSLGEGYEGTADGSDARRSRGGTRASARRLQSSPKCMAAETVLRRSGHPPWLGVTRPQAPQTGGRAAYWGSPRWGVPAAARAIGCRLLGGRGWRDLRGSGAAAATPRGGGGVNEITAGVSRSSAPHSRGMNRRRGASGGDAGQRTWPWHGRSAQPLRRGPRGALQ